MRAVLGCLLVGLAACASSSAAGPWPGRSLIRVRSESSMIDGRVAYSIAIPNGLRMKGSEGASIWEGADADATGARFHVQVSYDHAPASLDEAAAKYGSSEVVAKTPTRAGYQLVHETTYSVGVTQTLAVHGGALICEASLTRSGGGELAGRAAGLVWLRDSICGGLRAE